MILNTLTWILLAGMGGWIAWQGPRTVRDLREIWRALDDGHMDKLG